MKTPSESTVVLLVLLLSGCGASKTLNQTKAREKILELGLVQLKEQNIQVEKISQSGDNQAVAEANLKLAFKLSKVAGKDWQVDAIRLGDRNWVEVKAFLGALNEVRSRETQASLQILVAGIRKYKERTGRYPAAQNIVTLTDILVPEFVAEVIRYDGWNRELILESGGSDSFRIISAGPDGIPHNSDDIALSP